MKEFKILKKLQSEAHKRGQQGKLVSSVVFRTSFTKKHNWNSPEHRLENLFNFSIWIGSPTQDRISVELFIVHHKGLRLPKTYLTNWNKKIEVDA